MIQLTLRSELLKGKLSKTRNKKNNRRNEKINNVRCLDMQLKRDGTRILKMSALRIEALRRYFRGVKKKREKNYCNYKSN